MHSFITVMNATTEVSASQIDDELAINLRMKSQACVLAAKRKLLLGGP